jgi:hypothetical protein
MKNLFKKTVGFLLLISSVALGVQEELMPILRDYQDRLEQRVRFVLAKHLEEGRFILYIKAQLDEAKLKNQISKKIPLLTLPKNVLEEDQKRLFFESLNKDTLQPYIKSILVQVTVDNSVNDTQSKLFQKIIYDVLDLNAKRGDKIQMSKAEFQKNPLETEMAQIKMSLQEANKAKQDYEDKIKKLESDSQNKLRELERSIQDKETELQKTQAKADKTQDNITKLEKQVSENKEELSFYQPPLGEIKKMIKGLEIPLTFIPITFLLFLAAIILGLISQWNSQRRLQSFLQGIQNVAASFQKKYAPTTIDKETSGSSSIGGVESSLNEEDFKEEATAAWGTLKGSLYFMASCLKDWLINEEGKMRFVQFSLGLDAEFLETLWRLYPTQDIQDLKDKLNNNFSKSQCYLSILQLQRLILQEKLQKPTFVENISPLYLIKMTDAQLTNIMDRASLEASAACLLFLTSSRSLRIIEGLTTYEPTTLILKMREVINLAEDRLRDLMLEIQNMAEEEKNESILSLLQGGSPKLQGSLPFLLQADPDLARQIQARMVTFADVLQLDKILLQELLDPLSPENIAILLTGLPPESLNRVTACVSQGVRQDAELEFRRLKSRGTLWKRAQKESLNWQQKLSLTLKQWIQDGIIDIRRSA